MKILFFSDIHGNGYTFKILLEYISANTVDKVIFCGDVFGYYYDQNYILKSLMERPDIQCLMGNHDRYFLDLLKGQIDKEQLVQRYGSSYNSCSEKVTPDQIEFICAFSHSTFFETDNCRVAVYHGSPSEPLEGRIYPDTELDSLSDIPDCDIIVCGHTHHKMVRKMDNIWFLNPGSLGQQRDGQGCSFAILNTDIFTWSYEIVVYDRQRLAMDIEHNDPGNDSLKEVLFRQGKPLVREYTLRERTEWKILSYLD